ncbi:MAG: hemolysin family protein [Mariprofundaceae bacterium]
MKAMIDRFLERLRSMLIERLRPGRDEAELLSMLGRAEAVQSDEHRRMLEQLVEFHDMRVRELMIPRSEIHAVAADMSMHEAEQAFMDSGVTRLPVMVGDLDHIQGVVYVWDVFAARVEAEDRLLTDMMRPCLKVSELEQVSGLLTEMKQKATHIAIVLDEYGGTAGLVTLSDLLTEIVGAMDEAGAGAEDAECERLENGSYLVQARMHVEELAEEIGCKLPEGDFDTVAGLITSELGRIPLKGERMQIAGLDMEVMQADPRRVLKVLILPTANGT